MMKALITCLRQFAPGVMFLALAVTPFHLLWANRPFERAQSETSREIIAAMISAHGGMEQWRSAPTVSFEDHFLPAGAKTPRFHKSPSSKAGGALISISLAQMCASRGMASKPGVKIGRPHFRRDS